jgi:hypothetical protein
MPNSRLSKFRLAAALLPMMIGSPAVAATALDATGDILPTFVGTATPDLDVTSFSVSFNSITNTFLLGASFAGPIDSTLPGVYVIGVDTGAGAIRPFANIGEPNVVFDQALIIQKDGSVTLGANTLSATVVGNLFTLSVAGNLFTSTGAAPGDFGFNIWPRIAFGNNNQITDFAPDNALLTANNALLTPAVPEPATWLMMILGFGVVGGAIRIGRARRRSAAPLDAFA